MYAHIDKTRRKDDAGQQNSLQKFYQKRWGLLFPLIGFLAFLWFLIRVLPKPSRATYPCQKVAMPLAFSFIAWVGGLTAAFFAAQKVKDFFRKSRWVLAACCFLFGLLGAYIALEGTMSEILFADDLQPAYEPALAPNTPIGVARGINPGRVVWAYDPDVVKWNGTSGYWWDTNNLDQDIVDGMISNTIRSLSNQRNDTAAWNAVFKHFNEQHGKGAVGYQAGEKIAVKLNLNPSGNTTWNSNVINNSPHMVLGLVRQLVNNAGVSQQNITFYDASRIVPDPIINRCHAEFPNVRFVDREGAGVRIAAQPDMSVAVHYARPDEVEDSGETYLPTCVTEASYLINIALLKGHDMVGLTLSAKNHFGSVYRERDAGDWNAGWSPGHMHLPIHVTGRFVVNWGLPVRPMGTYNSLVEMMGHEHLDGKALIWFVESFHATEHQSGSPQRWLSAPFNNGWTSSLFGSLDPVALQSVCLDFTHAEASVPGSPMEYNTRGAMDNYLHEAALAHDPPSGVTYDPENDGTPLQSLGVHEVWNNATDRQYSRNLGTGDGIELVQVSGQIPPFVEGDVSGDCSVGVEDLILVRNALMLDVEELTYDADVNGDGIIDILDLVFVRNRMGDTCE